ncbi:MAG: DUF1583 domain-containing protein [Planctomycetes bacterium]|nr:DUF1583 domain-containing protein [Planctomycetota bacterium]
MIRQSNFSECGHGFGKMPVALLLVLFLLGWGPATGGSALGQEAPQDTPTGVELAARHHQDKQFPEMIAVLDKVWKNDPESILKDAMRIGEFYADAKQGDALIRQIQKLDDTALMERYGDRLRYFAMVFAHRSDHAEVAIRTYAAVMKVTPIRFRCELAREYGDLLHRQARLPEAYEAYKLGFFPAGSDAGGAYTVPDQRYAAVFVTGEVSSPIIELADLAADMEAADRLRADVSEAIEDMPKWKPAGDLLLAMLSRREGNEQPIADLGSRCIDDPAYQARMIKLAGVLRQELSRCDGAGPLGVVESLWRKLEETGNDLDVVTALHQQALIKMRLGESGQARRFWLRIVDPQRDAKLTEGNLVYWRAFVAEQLKAHGFPVDALQLVRQILETDPSDLPERTSVEHLMEMTESALSDALEDVRAGNLEIVQADEIQIQELLLGLLLGKVAQGSAESDWRLHEKTVLAIAEAMVALGKRSGTLARLRQQWDAHPMADSLNLLALRAEAAMTDGDSGTAKRLLARISDLERATGETAPLWSPACLFFGFDDKLKAEFRDDLCSSELDGKVFKLMPPKLGDHVRTGSGGLCLNASPGVKAVGVAFTRPLRGDFDVTASYTIQGKAPPMATSGQTGSGACVRVWSRIGNQQLAGFFAVNGLEADEGGRYTMNRGLLGDGKHEIRSETAPTSARSGRLRVVRKGETLYFLAAENGSIEFRRLHQIDFTGDDAAGVRLGVQPVDPAAGMEVAWKDLVIRAEEIVARGARRVAAAKPRQAGARGATQAAAAGAERPVAVSGAAQSSEPARSPEPVPSFQRPSQPLQWVGWLIVILVASLSTWGLWRLSRAKRPYSG